VLQLGLGARVVDAVAGVDEGTLGGLQQPGELLDLLRQPV
jgi:hypothetical protein